MSSPFGRFVSTSNQLHLKEQSFQNFTQIMMKPFKHVIVKTVMAKLFRKYRFAKAARRTKRVFNFILAIYV